MDPVAAGFRIDGLLFPWGSTLATVAARLGLPAAEPAGHRAQWLDVPCAEIFGLAAVGAALMAPGPERPVLQATYRLAPLPGGELGEPPAWLGLLADSLGAPDDIGHRDLGDYRDPSNGVRCYASWARDGFGAGLSLYGGLRQRELGISAGGLHVDWADTVAAARPFVAAWQARADRLAALAQDVAEIHVFKLAMPQLPRVHGGIIGAARAAEHALKAPDVLPTPAPIAARLGAKGFGIWQAGGAWCISHSWDSVTFPLGDPVAATWHDVLPAKGAGHSEIDIARWSVCDVTGSAVIEQAVAALRALPGVTVTHQVGHDC